MPKIGKKSYYTKKLDAHFSLKVRGLGKCQSCGITKGQMQMAHIISRNNRTLRWDEKNLLCLCPTCHFKFHQDPLEFAKFIKGDFPKRYAYLMKRKNEITRYTAKELKEKVVQYTR